MEKETDSQRFVRENNFSIWSIILAITITGETRHIVMDHEYGIISCIVDAIIIVCFLSAFVNHIKEK